MRQLTRGLVTAAATAVLATVAVVQVANAVRRVPAFYGRATVAGDQRFTNVDIFANRTEGRTDQASERDLMYHVPLPLDAGSTVSRSVTFSINSPSTQSWCRAGTVNRNGTGLSVSARRFVDVVNSWRTLTTVPVSIGTNNMFFAECLLTNITGLTLFSYDQ